MRDHIGFCLVLGYGIYAFTDDALTTALVTVTMIIGPYLHIKDKQ